MATLFTTILTTESKITTSTVEIAPSIFVDRGVWFVVFLFFVSYLCNAVCSSSIEQKNVQRKDNSCNKYPQFKVSNYHRSGLKQTGILNSHFTAFPNIVSPNRFIQ